MRLAVQLTTLLSILLIPVLSLSHPGGLNAEGCNNNRRTGECRCHRSSGSSRASSTCAQAELRTGQSGRCRLTPVRQLLGGPGGWCSASASWRSGLRPKLDRDNDGVGCE